MLSQPLSQAMGMTVIVENKAGAGGVIGTLQFAKKKADGYTLLPATCSTNAAAPRMHAKLNFDPINISPRSLPLPPFPTCWWCLRSRCGTR